MSTWILLSPYNEVIEYVVRKYGTDRTPRLSPLVLLRPGRRCRDGLGVPLGSRCPCRQPFGESLDSALEITVELKNAYEQDEEARRVLDTTRYIEGFPAMRQPMQREWLCA